MRILHSDRFDLPLPEDHRFPMEKYQLLRERVESELAGGSIRMLVPEPATNTHLQTVHDQGYVERVTSGSLTPSEIRRIGFPWSEELVERSRRSVGGTIEAAKAALEDGISANLSGGTHHAFPDWGEGFCVFNDVAVASRVVQEEGLARRIGILDLDVHQGNGTAYIFRDDPEVFTLSVHGANNFPFRKRPSDLDLELPDGAGDEVFLEIAEQGIRTVLESSHFDLAFFLAGADPYVGDRLGRLAVTKAGLLERDRLVMTACRKAAIPVAIVMSGGYADPIDETVDIHFQTVELAAGLFEIPA